MYRVDRNDFYTTAKDSTVYTPSGVSEFIFDIVHDKIERNSFVLDPCVGEGSLLKPFKQAGFDTVGIDIDYQGHPRTIIRDFIAVEPGEIPTPGLVIANPPFNIEPKTKAIVSQRFGRRPLLPEVWLSQCLTLWGGKVPLILFAPYGMRLNQSLSSARWSRFVSGEYPEICSIIALPKDVYKGVLFHSEILIFNIHGLRAHYFYHG